MKVYCISGLGANCSVFEEIVFPDNYEKVYLEWKQPQKNETLAHYALRMAEEIDTSEPFVLFGLSFGGVVAQEIAQHYPPNKLILISTIKSREEFPWFFHLGKITKGYRLIPLWFFTSEKAISYAFFRKLYSPHLPELRKIFTYKDSYYLRWSIHQILHWEPKPVPKNTFHIHGTKDPLFPFRKIKETHKVENGNHIMIAMKSKSVSTILHEILSNKNC